MTLQQIFKNLYRPEYFLYLKMMAYILEDNLPITGNQTNKGITSLLPFFLTIYITAETSSFSSILKPLNLSSNKITLLKYDRYYIF